MALSPGDSEIYGLTITRYALSSVDKFPNKRLEAIMTSEEDRPPIWVGHVALYSKQIRASQQFMLQIGLRAITGDDDFALLEMRGGTHLVLTNDAESQLLGSKFDMMVEDLDATHLRFTELGLKPGKIERGKIHDSFEIREPGGNMILFNSSHVGDLPV